MRARLHALAAALVEQGVDLMISAAILRWVRSGISPGGWGLAVLSNDLRGAVLLADSKSESQICPLVRALEAAPALCWGSLERAQAWDQVGGLEGMIRKKDQG